MSENLWAISIDPDESMREYVLLQLKVKAMRDLLFRSRIFTYLAAATPGLKELVTIGKIWELALEQPQGPRTGAEYDLVSSTRPATGHGVGFLQTPRTFAEHRPGRPDPPAGRDARHVHPRPGAHRRRGRRAARGDAGQRDRGARARSRRARSASRSTAIYCNGLYPERFDDAEAERSRPRRRAPTTARRAAACRAALTEHRRAARPAPAARPARRELRGAGEHAAVHVRARARRSSEIERAGDGAVGLMAGDRRATRGQADLHLRRLGRGRQDDHLGGDRRRDGGAGQAGRGADDRPGQAARRLARAARARQRPSARSIRRCSPARGSRPSGASSGR